jgi:hypothetical protein
VWREFEEQHGNEDTFKDMLRVQRSVETAFSQVSERSCLSLIGFFLSSELFYRAGELLGK